MCTKETNGIFARERNNPCKRTVFATYLTAVKYHRSFRHVERRERKWKSRRANELPEIKHSIDIRESEYSHSEKLLMFRLLFRLCCNHEQLY